MPERGSQTAVARLGHGTSMCSPQSLQVPVTGWKVNPRVLLQFLVPGREALETKVLGAVSKGKSRNTEGGTRHSAVSCPFLVLAQGTHHKAKKHPFVCLFWSPAPPRCPWWTVLCARRMGCSQQKLPLTPITLLVSEAHMSKEDIHIHAEMLDLPPPQLLPPSGLEAGNEDTDASVVLALGMPLLPAPRGISRLHHLPKALLHPPWTQQDWKERGQAACPVTPPQPP